MVAALFGFDVFVTCNVCFFSLSMCGFDLVLL